MSKRIISLLFIFSLLLSYCGIIYADSTPAINTKLRVSTALGTGYVLNVYINANQTPAADDQVRIWEWDDNDTQWWKTNYYMTYGGVSAYILQLYSYPSLMINDYHTQSGHYCTLYTSTNNSYTDFCFYWEVVSNLYEMYLFSYNRYLEAASAANHAYCYWTVESYGTDNHNRWAIVPLT